MAESMKIDRFEIGGSHPPFVIAEAGVNHNGSLELAFELVDAAVAAGSHAVKFQAFKADRLVTRTAAMAGYQARNTGRAESQHEMLRRLELGPDEFGELQRYCDQQGILFLCTPFDRESAEELLALGVPALKVSSGEVTNLPFLEFLARQGVPVILSTGMADLGEVEAAVRTVQAGGAPLALLHCTTDYPCSPGDVNLRAMETMRQAFGVPVGYSDHTEGIEVTLAAVAMGAGIIEKHFTLSRDLPGPDHKASLEPDELRSLTLGAARIWQALGNGRKLPAPKEYAMRATVRKSLVAAADLAEGLVLGPEHLEIKRPGTGIAPSMYGQVLGRPLRRAVKAGTVLTWEDV